MKFYHLLFWNILNLYIMHPQNVFFLFCIGRVLHQYTWVERLTNLPCGPICLLSRSRYIHSTHALTTQNGEKQIIGHVKITNTWHILICPRGACIQWFKHRLHPHNQLHKIHTSLFQNFNFTYSSWCTCQLFSWVRSCSRHFSTIYVQYACITCNLHTYVRENMYHNTKWMSITILIWKNNKIYMYYINQDKFPVLSSNALNFSLKNMIKCCLLTFNYSSWRNMTW